MKKKLISRKISLFHGRIAPEEALLAGYGALIESYDLAMPYPKILTLISFKQKRKYTTPEWRVFPVSYTPKDELYNHLVFAIKYEGIDLLFFKKLFEKLEPRIIEGWVKIEPISQYSRKIWFLYEWLMKKQLSILDTKSGNYFTIIDEKTQYGTPKSVNSGRHRIKNNLPGTADFCPLIFKTPKLEQYILENFPKKTNELIKKIQKDIILRTSAFLLLKDSKASFTIENEKPIHNRAARWGKVIGQAGNSPLCKEEFLRLQQIVIENSRFLKMGYRTEGGFIGEHDRTSGEPIPEHISARWQDLEKLMSGLIISAKKMEEDKFHPVLASAIISFGFVFIHPFVDGNGRIHRYLIHHLLASMKFTPKGIIFPISAAILERIDEYRKVLESYSQPLLDLIEWEMTTENNVNVLNDTIDFYRYFDATVQSEFLFECVEYTIKNILPEEIRYLQNFDKMKNWLDNHFQMPDKLVSLLIRFLKQNDGRLSKRARETEFSELTLDEINKIENHYKSIYNN